MTSELSEGASTQNLLFGHLTAAVQSPARALVNWKKIIRFKLTFCNATKYKKPFMFSWQHHRGTQENCSLQWKAAQSVTIRPKLMPAQGRSTILITILIQFMEGVLERRFKLTVYHLLKTSFYILPAQRKRPQSGMKSIVLRNVLYPGRLRWWNCLSMYLVL